MQKLAARPAGPAMPLAPANILLPVLPIISFAGGAYCLGLHAIGQVAQQVLAPAGIVLMLTSLAQARLLFAAWQSRRTLEGLTEHRRILNALALGLVGSYLITAAFGPGPYGGAMMTAAFSVFATLAMLPLAASPRVVEIWKHWTNGRTARRTVRAFACLSVALICCEAVLQLERIGREYRADVALPMPRPAAAVHVSDTPSLLADELDLRFVSMNAGRFRLVIVGEAGQLGGSPRACIARLQRDLQGLEIVPVALERPWSLGPSADLEERVVAAKPDLVLALVNGYENLVHAPVAPGWFEWRAWELSKLLFPCEATPADVADASKQMIVNASSNDAFEDYLDGLVPELIACRSPISDDTGERWQRSFRAMDALNLACLQQSIPVSVVAVPSRIQLDPALFEMVVRRTGGKPEQFDVGLPQRSLAAYAEGRGLRCLDLLPVLRTEGRKLFGRNTAAWSDRGNTAVAGAIGGWLESCYGSQLALAVQSANR
jgi:hypothetical protein